MPDTMTNTERLAAVCECSVDDAAVMESVARMVAALDMGALSKGIQTLQRMQAVAPLLDPTACREALADGRLERGEKALRALRDCAAAPREIAKGGA